MTPDAVVQPSVGSTATSLAQMFLDRVRLTPDKQAFLAPTDPGWQSYSWRDTHEVVMAWAAGLIALGVEPEQRVGIASNTSVQWIFADLAVSCTGAATTTVYATTLATDVAYILSDSDTRVVFAENREQLDKLVEMRAEIPQVFKVILLGDFDAADGDFAITTDELARLGRQRLAQDPEVVTRTVAGIRPDALATLIYTSGTTGRPKGVRLTQANWVYEGNAFEALGVIFADDLMYVFLPLAHSFGKVLISIILRVGCVYAVDGRVETIQANLAEVKPTIVPAVPRIFEKIHAGLLTRVEREGGIKSRLFGWAMGVAAEAGDARRTGKHVGGLLGLKHAIADRLVLSKVREAMGGRVRFFVSAAAPLSTDISQWFDNAGLLLMEAYGLTETSAGCCCNTPDDNIFGTVGPPLPGTELKIAEDGEVLVKGPCVMEGYHNLPEQTAEVFTDGWFHTGDIGEMVDGHLKITDRKKDLIKTSGGKYVAPQSIEIKFKAVCPYVSNIVVHGDGRNFVAALVALDPESIMIWGEERGITGTYQQVVTSPEAREMVGAYIDEVNAQLPRWETVKKFEVLTEDLTIEAGDLTPSFKVKRKVVEQKYAEVLDGFYT
jgi:long-chain acyl-CoA synthetase